MSTKQMTAELTPGESLLLWCGSMLDEGAMAAEDAPEPLAICVGLVARGLMYEGERTGHVRRFFPTPAGLAATGNAVQ
jgi:hypothetical protein